MQRKPFVRFLAFLCVCCLASTFACSASAGGARRRPAKVAKAPPPRAKKPTARKRATVQRASASPITRGQRSDRKTRVAASTRPRGAKVEARETKPKEPPKPRPQLPLGGRSLFPQYRLVGFCGTPGAPALGRLRGNLDIRATNVASMAKKYEGDRPVMQVYELIAVIVQGEPGKDKKWRRRVKFSVVDRYLAAARKNKALLLLNIQPGHSDFLSELKYYEKYLREPDVGVALDPEWAMKPKQKPGAYFGQTKGPEIDKVAEYLSGIVKAGDLPEKPLVFHQVNGYVVKDEEAIASHPGIVVIKSVDGLGPQGAKKVTYRALTKTISSRIHAGFKLFFDEDQANGHKLMSPKQVLSLAPEPEYVMYE